MGREAHTAGPWVVDFGGSSVHSKAEGLPKNRVHGYGYGDNGFICDLNDGEYHEYTDREEQEANARLIAAAPDMFAALSGMVGEEMARRGCIDPADDSLTRARAALQRATGASE